MAIEELKGVYRIPLAKRDRDPERKGKKKPRHKKDEEQGGPGRTDRRVDIKV